MRVGILISGRGSNMSSLIEAARAPGFPAEIALVVSNRPDAAGLERAAQAGIATAIVDHKAYPDRARFEAALSDAFTAAGVELICLAGFMRILSDGFVDRWAGRMLNIHPSLLPSFRGLHPHRQALEAGVRIHGCTVHFVVPAVDSGPIVMQAAIPVRAGDSEDDLAARVLAQEHAIYPQALRFIASGAVRLIEGQAEFAAGETGAVGLVGA